MDKSFNEQELSDIMKEIEALEEGLKAEAETSPASSSAPMMPTMEGEPVSPIEDVTAVMQELADMEAELATPATNYSETKVLPFEAATTPTASSVQSTKTPASMSFKVQGDLKLQMQFELAGKAVMLDVSETGITITMENGATFSVPVGEAKPFKKAI